MLLRQSNLIALALLLLIAGIASPYFFELRNITNVLRGAAPLAIAAVGMTLVILTRGVDLSIGSILGVSAMIAGIVAPVNAGLGIVAALVAGTLLGAVNGLLIIKLRLQPFIATLAMLISARGLVYIITDGANLVIRSPPAWFTFIGSGYVGPVPVPVLLALLVWIGVAYMLSQTQFGKHIYAIGANEEASRLYGVKVERIKLLVYCISGFCGALAGVVLVTRLGVAEPNAGQLMELDAISAALIGGTNFDGGIGGVHGTIMGAIIMSLLANVLNLLGISPFVQMLLQGFIIVAAVVVADLKQRRRS